MVAPDQVAQIEPRAKEYATKILLPIKNESWLDDDVAPITQDQFKSLILLEAIHLRADGEIELFYKDGDLFEGHSILVILDREGNEVDATIAG